jgi:hypothetical protein
MAGFAIVYIVAVVRRNGFIIDNGFISYWHSTARSDLSGNS